jgi:hypothetical protein
MYVDPKTLKDPKMLIPSLTILLGAMGTGTLLGFTIEPKEMTQLRVENAMLKERTTNLESRLQVLSDRVILLEQISDGCREVLSQCKETR